jgi:hypothetical protein
MCFSAASLIRFSSSSEVLSSNCIFSIVSKEAVVAEVGVGLDWERISFVLRRNMSMIEVLYLTANIVTRCPGNPPIYNQLRVNGEANA